MGPPCEIHIKHEYHCYETLHSHTKILEKPENTQESTLKPHRYDHSFMEFRYHKGLHSYLYVLLWRIPYCHPQTLFLSLRPLYSMQAGSAASADHLQQTEVLIAETQALRVLL